MVLAIIILSIIIPVTSAVTGFFVLKAVQLGLRWKIQIEQQQQPTMETNDIVPAIANPFKKEEEIELTPDIIDEWQNGPKESR